MYHVPPNRRIPLAAGGLVIASLTSFMLLFGGYESSREALGSLCPQFPSAATSTSSSSMDRCPSHCVSDPFAAPGMIHFGGNFSDTRWVPFPKTPYIPQSLKEGVDALPEQTFLALTSIDEVVATEVLARAAPPYLKWLSEDMLGELEFMRNRSIVLIGSSHDRNNVNQLCDVAKGKYAGWGGHVGGVCHISRLNLTIANWFTYGMVDSEEAFEDWRGKYEQGPGVFANRVKDVFVPQMELAGLMRTPDLVIMASLFWDEGFLDYNRQRSGYNTRPAAQHGYTFPEMNWHRLRLHNATLLVRQMWGHDVPLMYRTRQLRKVDSHWGLLKIFQLDQSCRATAKELNVRLFTWGGHLEGFSEYYDGDQHFALGPSTYIFGNMLFYYLRRAISEGCWSCDQLDV